VIYAGAILVAPVLLRHDAALGFAGIMLLFAVVWCTDIAAYFAGRAFGGPKLMPRVSPNKTWSGAFGGAVAAIAGGIGVAHVAGLGNLVAIGLLALVLSIVSQAGDLFESALKRRFDVKDASNLLPGHGGLMDRLDGFVTASAAATLIGVVRGGLETPARGLLVW
jgi:phosphatidate cytidylyltransferase